MPRLLLAALGGFLALVACAALAAPRFSDIPSDKAANSVEVDVELVMAVDISYSMDTDELRSSAKVTPRRSPRRTS